MPIPTPSGAYTTEAALQAQIEAALLPTVEARDADTLTESKAYTDVSFAATAPGGATDAALDAAVDRAVLGGRLTDSGTNPLGKGEPIRIDHPAGATVDAVKVVNQSTTRYALKVDQMGAGHDAVNIAAPATGGHTALGVLASNTSLSTTKITNDAAQTGGVVVAGLGTHPGRTGAIFGAENSGGGSSYLSTMKSGATGAAFQAVYEGVTSFSSRILWLKGLHSAGDLAYIENAGVQTSGSLLRLVQSDAASTAHALSITNNGTGLSILAPSFELRKNGNIAATSIFNYSTFNNARVALNTNGTVIDRNAASTTPALTVNQIHASNVGDVLQLQRAGSTVARVSAAGHLGVKASTEPTDVQAGESVFWVDATANPPRLMVATKSAAGAVVSTPAALTTAAREARADYVASWMRQEVWNDRGDRFPAGAVRRIRLKKPTLTTPYLTHRYTGDEDVNSTSASLSLQFLALYATHFPHKASDVRPLVDHLASYLMGMQVNDPTQARHGGIPLAANDTSCGTLSAAQAGIGFLKAYEVWGAGEWMSAALRVGEFLRTMIDPNPKYQALYGVNVIDVPAGTVPIADRITSGDVFRCTATGWNLTACKFLYQLADATGDESWRALATPARDFMATIVTGGYDYFHTKGHADGIAAGRVITNWTNQSSLDFNDNQFHRQGDAISPPNGTVGTDQLEYGLSALYETGYDLTALRTAYEYWVSLPNAEAASAPTFAPNYDGRVCLTGYIRFDSVVYEGASMAFGSYYDAQGAGELLKWKQEQYPEHYALSLPIVQAVLHPEAGALLDENYQTVWSAEEGGYTATQGVIPIAMSGIGLMETTADYDMEVTA